MTHKYHDAAALESDFEECKAMDSRVTQSLALFSSTQSPSRDGEPIQDLIERLQRAIRVQYGICNSKGALARISSVFENNTKSYHSVLQSLRVETKAAKNHARVDDETEEDREEEREAKRLAKLHNRSKSQEPEKTKSNTPVKQGVADRPSTEPVNPSVQPPAISPPHKPTSTTAAQSKVVATTSKITKISAQQSITSSTAQTPAVNLQKESVSTPDKTPKTPTQQPVTSLTAQGAMFNTPRQPVATSVEVSNSSAKQPAAKNPSPKSIAQAAELARNVTRAKKVILGPRRHAAIIQCAANVLAEGNDDKFDIAPGYNIDREIIKTVKELGGYVHSIAEGLAGGTGDATESNPATLIKKLRESARIQCDAAGAYHGDVDKLLSVICNLKEVEAVAKARRFICMSYLWTALGGDDSTKDFTANVVGAIERLGLQKKNFDKITSSDVAEVHRIKNLWQALHLCREEGLIFVIIGASGSRAVQNIFKKVIHGTSDQIFVWLRRLEPLLRMICQEQIRRGRIREWGFARYRDYRQTVTLNPNQFRCRWRDPFEAIRWTEECAHCPDPPNLFMLQLAQCGHLGYANKDFSWAVHEVDWDGSIKIVASFDIPIGSFLGCLPGEVRFPACSDNDTTGIKGPKGSGLYLQPLRGLSGAPLSSATLVNDDAAEDNANALPGWDMYRDRLVEWMDWRVIVITIKKISVGDTIRIAKNDSAYIRLK